MEPWREGTRNVGVEEESQAEGGRGQECGFAHEVEKNELWYGINLPGHGSSVMKDTKKKAGGRKRAGMKGAPNQYVRLREIGVAVHGRTAGGGSTR